MRKSWLFRLRGVRPFLSDKYDITKHKRYKLLSDYSDKNFFDIKKYLSTNLEMQPEQELEVYDIGAVEE